MFAERLAKRNRRTKRARAMPEEEPAAGPGKPWGVRFKDHTMARVGRDGSDQALEELGCISVLGSPLILEFSPSVSGDSVATDPFSLCAAKKQRRQQKSVFDEELTNTSKKALKQYRAG